MRRVFAALAVLTVVATGTGAYLATSRGTPGATTEVEIPPGTSTAGIATILRTSGVIGSEIGFRLMARVRGLDGSIQAGRYELAVGMGVNNALDALRGGPTEKVSRLTVPEGYTVRQIAARVGDRTPIATSSFEAALAAPPVVPSIRPAGVTSLEGFLFPETYVVGERETADGLLGRMIATFESKAAGLDWSAAASRGLSPYQALVLASLVEREAKVAEDRPKVAAVVYNRLAKGMRLQIDATVLYDLPQHKVPNRKDLERDSPYNTYLRDGLPPTPIANPGLASLQAALDPAPISALYYVVIDPSGRHGFADTYQEFQRMLKLRPPETRG